MPLSLASSMIRRLGRSSASCRHSSLPIEPLAPVTSTVLPRTRWRHLLAVDLDRVPPEQILERQVAEQRVAERPARRHPDAAALDRRQRARQRLDLGRGLLADRDDLPQLAPGDGVDRQHDQVDALALDHPRDLVAPAEHLAPVDQHAVLADVVVHEPDDLVALGERPVLQLPAEVLAGLARPDDQHR